jgi:hypothetical protein
MEKFGSWIRNKQPKSATLLYIEYFRCKKLEQSLAYLQISDLFLMFLSKQQYFRRQLFVQGGCDHICIPTGVTSRTCGCSVGFQKTPGNKQDVESRLKRIPVSYCINSVPDPDPYISGLPDPDSKLLVWNLGTFYCYSFVTSYQLVIIDD